MCHRLTSVEINITIHHLSDISGNRCNRNGRDNQLNIFYIPRGAVHGPQAIAKNEYDELLDKWSVCSCPVVPVVPWFSLYFNLTISTSD